MTNLAVDAVMPLPTTARRYTLLRRLAVGGMGELLLASATAAGGVHKLVAIKRVRPEYASDPAFVTMFLNEARLAATLDHPNVVRTYDLVEDGGSFFMVMEYLHGESLGRVLNAVAGSGETMPLSHVVTIVLGVAAGLHCAHERRGTDGRPLDIVHRDLSPGNVFVTYDGGIKLLDFGIAKATSRTSITVGPARKGKVAYMSPEQCVGEDVDRRSDIFALGIVMWELCTGRRLFRGDNEFSIMNQITTIDAPSPKLHVADLPDALCEIIGTALRRDRKQRFQSAMDLHDAVEAFAREQGILPSSAAVGRWVEDLCGRREYPLAQPSEEFVDRQSATLVVPADPPPSVAPRRWSVVLALAAGAIAGAVAVAASSSSEPLPPSGAALQIETPPETVAASERDAEAAAPKVEVPEGGEVPTVPTAEGEVQRPQLERGETDRGATADPPGPAARGAEVEPTPTRSARSGRKAKSSRRATKRSREAAEPDDAVRGVDGLLPRGSR